MTPIFFRWSRGFELNGQKIRCATDQSSEDPSGIFLEAYPEMKDDVYFPSAPDDSQRYRCDSNSSLFMYNPQTRRVHLVGNGHCLVVSRMSYHDGFSEDYPVNRILKSVDCKRTATNESTSSLIWGSEFRLVHDNNSNSKMALRFISPTDGHEWTIYSKSYVLIVAENIQQQIDRLKEPWLEIVNKYMPDG
ncbi:unnamed protein product [Adineta steineri]|uniref:Uncharacterized protein n=1 Tax=Adineta steineri TaxID=433720 RepID=A0A815I408_9BILA|nr:unnamed protein product [Adineta steineri]CAF1430669.1 unnamed protein product [Adineta steineri]CAF3787826.1 unnamed protein product [Adineta steineri]CAF4087239.1 unnamed protein product [Adineta steineri]